MKYDLIVVFKPENKEADATLFTTFLEKEGFSVSNGKWWGKRTLAYRIKKFTEGNYWSAEISSTTAKPKQMEVKLNQNENIIRYLITIKKED